MSGSHIVDTIPNSPGDTRLTGAEDVAVAYVYRQARRGSTGPLSVDVVVWRSVDEQPRTVRVTVEDITT